MGNVIFEVQAKDIKTALEIGVKRRVSFRELFLTGADLNGVKFEGIIDLRFADLSGCDFRGSNLGIEADLTKAILVGTKFDDARCSCASFCEANLRSTSLIRANFQGASFIRANLTEADMTDACLSRTLLENAVLDQAILNRTNFEYAFLRGVNIKKAWDVRKANLKNAMWDYS